MAVREISRGKWLVRVIARDGRTDLKARVERTIRGTKRDALALEEAIRADITAGPDVRQHFAEYAARWVESRRASLKPSTYHRHEQAIRCHLGPAFGDWRMDAIAAEDVQRYVGERAKAGASAHTIRNEIRTLGVMLRDAVASGAIPKDPTARVRLPVAEGYTDERPNLLRADELRRLFAVLPPQWVPLISFMTFTGARWGEASALRWEDLDEARGVIRVRRSNWRGQAVTPKTRSSSRTIPLTRAILAALGERKPSGWIYPAASGELHRGTPLNKVLRKACEAAGVPRVSPHGLRRTFIDLTRRIADRVVVRSLTGQATDRMIDHYSLADDDERISVIDFVVGAAGG